MLFLRARLVLRLALVLEDARPEAAPPQALELGGGLFGPCPLGVALRGQLGEARAQDRLNAAIGGLGGGQRFVTPELLKRSVSA